MGGGLGCEIKAGQFVTGYDAAIIHVAEGRIYSGIAELLLQGKGIILIRPFPEELPPVVVARQTRLGSIPLGHRLAGNFRSPTVGTHRIENPFHPLSKRTLESRFDENVLHAKS